jgi:hypothetical protein
MRPLAIAALSGFAAGIMFGFIGRAAQSEVMFLLAGFGFLTAMVSAIAMIPIVRNLPWPPKMTELFPAIEGDEQFNSMTGDKRV